MLLQTIKRMLQQDAHTLTRYDVAADEQRYLTNSTFIPLERGKHYSWTYTYNLLEGNESSSYAVVVLFDEHKKRSGQRLKVFKKHNGTPTTERISFTTPLQTSYAQCHFILNAKNLPERSATVIELPAIKDATLTVTTSTDEEYDDIFDYHTKYAAVDLEAEPWLAIGSPHEHIGTIKNFTHKLETLRTRYGWTPDSTVLDIGCGTGGLANEIQKFTNSPKNYVGVELVQKGVDYCKQHYPQFEFYKGEMTSVPHFDRTFDFICLYNVIIHMHPDDTIKLLTDAKQYLAPNGQFLITATINNDIPRWVGDKGRVEMTDAFFEELMHTCGFSYIEKVFPQKTEGQMPFIVRP